MSIEAPPTTTVVGIDLTDLGPDGQPDPLAAVLNGLACSAARVAAVPEERTVAAMTLGALQATAAEAMPFFADLCGHLTALIEHAQILLEDGETND